MDNHNDHNNIDADDMADARRQPILLTPEGQQLFDVLESYIKKELPPYTNSTMNEMVNNMAAEGVAGDLGGGEEAMLLSTVRTSVVDCLFGRDNNNDIISDEERGLTTTIVDTEEWPKEEKWIETALRFFPDILLEERDGYSLIQWLSMREEDKTYNLKNISLIPLVTKLGSELQQFDDGLRGGLLSPYPSGLIPLDHIICYHAEGNNELRDDCFSTVRNWMRENNYLLNEDIQRYNLVGHVVSTNIGFLSEYRLQYLVSMDPVSLSLPCYPESGNMLPIHSSTIYEDILVFSMLLKVGMQYYPDKFGFVFSEGIHLNNGQMFQGTAFQQACKNYGREKVINEVINCVTEYCSSALVSTSTSTTTTKITETSLLLSTIPDKTIHIDGLYILLRKDPAAALLKRMIVLLLRSHK